jgi:hypothetical protein
MASSGTCPALGRVIEIGGDWVAAQPLAAVAPQQLLPPVFTRKSCLAILFFDYFLDIGGCS